MSTTKKAQPKKEQVPTLEDSKPISLDPNKSTGDLCCFSVDMGFSHAKCVLARMPHLIEMFKDRAAIVIMGDASDYAPNPNKDENDPCNVIHDGVHYMVGGDSLQITSQKDRILEVNDFETMKLATVLVLKKYLINMEYINKIDKLFVSLSFVYIDKAPEYKKYIIKSLELEDKGISPKFVTLSTQGVSGQVAIKKLGLDPKNPSVSYANINNCLVIDGGFNTIDVCQVVNGNLVPNSKFVKAEAGVGVIMVAKRLQNIINERLDVDISLPRTKEVLETGYYKLKGEAHSFAKEIDELFTEYVKETAEYIRDVYTDPLNAVENIIILGGFAEILRKRVKIWQEMLKTSEDFILIPKENAEYFNAIGAIFFGR